MPQASATWDIEVLGCPALDGYLMDQGTVQRITEPLDGPFRYRRVLETGVITAQIRVVQTSLQYEAFRDFYYQDLNYGRLWFWLPIIDGVLPIPLLAHITPDGFQQQRHADLHFRHIISLDVECFRAETLAYSAPAYSTQEQIVVDAGLNRAGGIPPVADPGDLVDAGTPASPSPDTDVLYGGDDLGLMY